DLLQTSLKDKRQAEFWWPQPATRSTSRAARHFFLRELAIGGLLAPTGKGMDLFNRPGRPHKHRHHLTATHVVGALVFGSLFIPMIGCQSSKVEGCEVTRTCRGPESSGGEAGAASEGEPGGQGGRHTGVSAGGGDTETRAGGTKPAASTAE